ncbi:MAG TPA: metallophosphoesterase family protein [Anaerohalosphaeraceae bacterium]|nr:metallophosphoesterase family protein [Anaerohalosphaeraceae bacterium]
MRLLIISDIHGQVDKVKRLSSALKGIELVLIAGDITTFGGADHAAAVLEPLLSQSVPVLAVPGNCDPEGVSQYLESKQISLQGRTLQQGGYLFVGAGGSLPCPGLTPNECNDSFFETILCKALYRNEANSAFSVSKRLILVTHQPAFGTAVDTVAGRSTGSPSIRRFIETHQPVLAVSGHIHEAFGTDRIGLTVLVNPGPLKQGRYATVDIKADSVVPQLHTLD